MTGSRFAVFLTIVLAIWAGVHAYVFSRLSSVPWISAHLSHRVLIVTAILLWLSYVVARTLGSWHLDLVAVPLEFVAATWMGVLFLVFAALLVTDALTLGGWLLPGLAPRIRGWAVITAAVLAGVALVQGLRPPVVREHTVELAGLPTTVNGLRLVMISDLHLGTQIGARWLTRLVARVNGLKPDLIVAVGDILDGNARRIEPLVPVLAGLRAPLGVWAVTGNHEYYAGVDECVAQLEKAGWRVLRDSATEVTPGLMLAGVDDLTARQQFGDTAKPLERVLTNRSPSAVILLSHSPWQAETAAALGAGLMLSGHTHGGQIWPFNYVVRLRYPLVEGRHEVAGMPAIVCRGTGTWGPRMRLWGPAEILWLTLRSPGA